MRLLLVTMLAAGCGNPPHAALPTAAPERASGSRVEDPSRGEVIAERSAIEEGTGAEPPPDWGPAPDSLPTAELDRLLQMTVASTSARVRDAVHPRWGLTIVVARWIPEDYRDRDDQDPLVLEGAHYCPPVDLEAMQPVSSALGEISNSDDRQCHGVRCCTPERCCLTVPDPARRVCMEFGWIDGRPYPRAASVLAVDEPSAEGRASPEELLRVRAHVDETRARYADAFCPAGT
jgi:hypothetical protein